MLYQAQHACGVPVMSIESDGFWASDGFSNATWVASILDWLFLCRLLIVVVVVAAVAVAVVVVAAVFVVVVVVAVAVVVYDGGGCGLGGIQHHCQLAFHHS